MTLLLASVTGAEEAEIAVQHGADIIDLKEVGTAFGAVAPEVISATVNSVARRRPVSAVAGELEMAPAIVARAVAAVADAGAEYVKVGLYPDHRREDCIRALMSLARRVRLIGVMFADYGADDGLIALMAQSGFAGVMIDTASKTDRRLLDHMHVATIGRFVTAARSYGLMAGLAGLAGGAGRSAAIVDVPRRPGISPCAVQRRRPHLEHQRRGGRCRTCFDPGRFTPCQRPGKVG